MTPQDSHAASPHARREGNPPRTAARLLRLVLPADAVEAIEGDLLELFRARAAATRVLSFWRHRAPEPMKLLSARLADPHPRVRLEAVRACSYFTAEEAQEAVLDVLEHDMDGYLEYTLDETLRALESQ